MGEPVPEGQVARDAKFWATHYAVQEEHERAAQILKCERDSHQIVFERKEPVWCTNCPLTGDELMISAGFRRTKKGWKWP